MQTTAPELNLVRNLKLPPAGFNIRTATERELLTYGLPRRPDEARFPAQAALWDSVSRRPLRFVRPALIPVTNRARPHLIDYKPGDLNLDPIVLDHINHRLGIIGIRLCLIIPLTSGNWSGAVAQRPASEPIVTVTGQWTVPSVSPPASAWNGTGYNDGTYAVSVWVGIDGASGTTDVLQAGTLSAVVVSGGVVTSTSYYPWIEWFGNASQPETDFTVSPGDSILCTVCAPLSNVHGTAMFTNLTTGVAVSYGIEPPTGVTAAGNVAEWIVEDPTQQNKQLFPFPNYGQTTFQNCGAGTKDIALNLNNACPMNLVPSTGTVLSEGIITGPTTLQCNYV